MFLFVGLYKVGYPFDLLLNLPLDLILEIILIIITINAHMYRKQVALRWTRSAPTRSRAAANWVLWG